MSIHSFNKEFLEHYRISDFFQKEKRGGQKAVHFPVIDGVCCVLKLFSGGKDERLERELDIYEKFKHLKGISKIQKVEIYGSDIVVFEEYVDGHTLVDIVDRYANDSSKISQLMKEIFNTMEPIWKSRYVHRDFKPANIMIKADGSPIIIDFGIARDLDASSITGAGWQPKSWMFAAPEQYSGNKDEISYRTDFFSLGCLAYFLYHQRLPFGNNETEVNNKFKSKDESFAVDGGFSMTKFCQEAMRFSPAERPRLIEDMYNLL